MITAANIDITSTCNLGCPSCPTGRGYGEPYLMALTDAWFLALTLKDKYPKLRTVMLFNWCEPFIHPQLPDIIRVFREHGFQVSVSTNGNLHRNLKAVLNSGLGHLRVSLSGMTQETYQKGHHGGRMEKVMEFLKIASELEHDVLVEICWHRYLDNLHEERDARAMAYRLGFSFTPVWATHMPIEGALFSDGNRTRYALTIKDLEGLPKRQSCPLRESQVAFDARGRKQLCCASQRISFCQECTALRGNLLATTGHWKLEWRAWKNCGRPTWMLPELVWKTVKYPLRRFFYL